MAKEIVVVQAGWVFIGNVSDDAQGVVIHEASNIRRWGTTSGLGEIAIKGPTAQTVMDYYGTVKVPTVSVLARIPCKV